MPKWFSFFLTFLSLATNAWPSGPVNLCEGLLQKPGPYLEFENFLESHRDLSKVSTTELVSKIDEFHKKSLEWNLANRSGMSRRVIYLLSTNPNKLPEYQNVFHRYGIEVLLAPRIEDPAYLKGLLEAKSENVKVISVLRETSDLYNAEAKELSKKDEHAERVENKTVLDVYTLASDHQLKKRTYQHSTLGYVDLARQSPGNPNVFGWDDVFVLDDLGASYHELRKLGFKISSRDMVLGQYMQDDIYYDEHVDLKFNPQAPKKVIDFAKPVSEFIEKNPLLNTESLKRYRLDRLFRTIANDGVFFRSPINRREKIYWLPGLNSGIPFTPKSDLIHEITYLVHDLGHARIPDLIYSGNDSSKHRQIYIAHRMMSEAMTLVMGDMLFVDSLAQEKIGYDFTKRKIFPLFKATGIDFSDQENFVANLKRLMRANATYCLRGDDSAYRELIGDSPEGLAALAQFKDKYMPFFVEDFRWTERNYANMASRSREIQNWYTIVSSLSKKLGIKLETIDEFMKKIDGRPGDVIDQVFEEVFESRIRPLFENDVALLPVEEQRKNAFSRYMLGQFGIFARYGFAPESLKAQQQLIQALTAQGAGKSLDSIEKIRGLYQDYVQRLLDRNLISLDDAKTYSEVYPMFDPFFVYYDGAKDSYEDLAILSKRILFFANEPAFK